jgi:hypothetical protein
MMTPLRHDQASCLSWVIRVGLTVRPLLPVFSRERTLSRSVGMSQKCQYQKSGTSFDHLVGTHEQR